MGRTKKCTHFRKSHLCFGSHSSLRTKTGPTSLRIQRSLFSSQALAQIRPQTTNPPTRSPPAQSPRSRRQNAGQKLPPLLPDARRHPLLGRQLLRPRYHIRDGSARAGIAGYAPLRPYRLLLQPRTPTPANLRVQDVSPHDERRILQRLLSLLRSFEPRACRALPPTRLSLRLWDRSGLLQHRQAARSTEE